MEKLQNTVEVDKFSSSVCIKEVSQIELFLELPNP